MFETTGLKTFAMSAKDLNKAVEFYTNVLGGQITRRVEPTAEQLNAGHVKEVDVRLGNFEVHLFDASKGPRAVDPHHTLNIPWQDQEKALSALRQIGANIEKVRPHRESPNYSINVFDPDGNRWELSFTQS
jgi:catechol 2,3-dioxygenase-like lactoylglutathione lyase family enzyme